MNLFQRKKVVAAVLTLIVVVGAAALAYKPLLGLYRKAAKLPDDNGMYEIDSNWFQVLEPVNESRSDSFAAKLNSLKETYLTEQNRVFVALVPDKGWYVKEEGYPTFEHLDFQQRAYGQLTDFVCIDLTDTLTLNSFFYTDRHWRQECLQPVLDKLGQAMDFSVQLDDFTQNEVFPFEGDFSKYITGRIPEESLFYLTNDATESAYVDNYQAPDVHTLYDLPQLEGQSPYNVFLSGITPIVTVTNENASTDKELVIFRDSYASSLAPLMCGEYRTITLIDLRFMHSSLLPERITFTDQDVLFLYSDWIASNSSLIR